MKLRKSGQSTELLLHMMLFCLFAFLALAVLLSGARVYRTFAGRMDSSFLDRTAAGYLTNKVRQFDAQGALALTKLENGATALALTVPGQEAYHTLIYYSDGAIREMFARTDVTLDPASGMEIVRAEGLDFVQTDGGLQVYLLGADNQQTEFFVSVRSEAD